MKKHKVVFKNVEISDKEMEAFMDFSKVSNEAKKAKSLIKIRRFVWITVSLSIILAIIIYLSTTTSKVQKNTGKEKLRPSSSHQPQSPVSATQLENKETDLNLDSGGELKDSADHRLVDKKITHNKERSEVNTKKPSPPPPAKDVVATTMKDSSIIEADTVKMSNVDLSLITPLENLPVKIEDSVTDKEGFPVIKKDDIYIKATPEVGFDRLFRYFYKNMKYPENARKAAMEGTVVVGFVVSETGKISNIKVVKGLSKELNSEAKRLVKEMPAWNAALLNSKPVKSKFTIPIKFSLEETSE